MLGDVDRDRPARVQGAHASEQAVIALQRHEGRSELEERGVQTVERGHPSLTVGERVRDRFQRDLAQTAHRDAPASEKEP